MISTAITMYGDLLALAVDGNEEAAALIAANPIPEPSIETDMSILKLAGMDVSAEDVRSLRAWYGGEERAA
ncbi:hypothetical protein [Nocardia xishanensis]|uniref:hypothetical protein n=1 Tax=Nocardia xishanensis TaxID=238964 RepID=UPI0008369A80|nr:hypothetical protein [Nocardia xishanensis]